MRPPTYPATLGLVQSHPSASESPPDSFAQLSMAQPRLALRMHPDKAQQNGMCQ